MATKPGSPSLQVGNALASGLVVGLMLYEGTGTTSTDLTGNGHDATLSGGATWTTDAAGNAVACTGGGYLSVPFPALASGDSFTLAIIHKPTSWPGGFTALMDNAGRDWQLDFGGSGDCSFNGGMFGAPGVGGGATGMTTGTLWQLLYLRDRSGPNSFFNVNGSAIGSGFNGGSAAFTAGTVYFGQTGGSGTNYDGLYDAIYLWNRVLSGADITALVSDPYQMFRPTGSAVIDEDPLIYQTVYRW